jgi:peptidoglycan hydrolase FlgJ
MTQPIRSAGQTLPPSSFPPRQNHSSPSRGGVPQVDRSQATPEMIEAAEGMEALFLDYMMKVMRQTIPKNDMDLESPATQLYRGMMDSEYAQKAAHMGGIGLADQIIAYLQQHQYNQKTRQDLGEGIPKKE